VDGVTFENMPKVTFGTAGFGIECPRIIGEIANPRFNLAHCLEAARSVAAGKRTREADCHGPTRPHALQHE